MKTSTDTSMRTRWFPKRKRIQRFTREKFTFENLEYRLLLHGHAGNAIELVAEDIPVPSASATENPNDFLPQPIVGGTKSEAGDWPWAVSLQNFGGHFCGGVLIGPDIVLTAAHCITGEIQDITAVIDRTDLHSAVGLEIPLVESVNHPNYVTPTDGDDIAVVFLQSAANVDPIRLIDADTLHLAAPGVDATAIGWGALQEFGPAVSELNEVQLPIISNDTANQPSSYDGQIIDSMLAAGLAQGGKDTCDGDSGGALMVPDDQGDMVLAGITSWGDGCAEPRNYGLYTRVSSYTDWIDSVVEIDSLATLRVQGMTARDLIVSTDTIWLTLEDSDLSELDSIQLQITSSHGDVELLTMTATNSGRFRGSIPLSETVAMVSDGTLNVVSGGSLQVTYTDLDRGDGQSNELIVTKSIVADDFGNDVSSATHVTMPVSVLGLLELADDRDWFSVDVEEDQTYRISVVLDTLTDSILTLYESDGETIIASNDDAGNQLGSELVYWAQASGAIHIEVEGFGGETGSYRLDVIETDKIADDHGNDATTARPLSVPSVLEAAIQFPTEVDWFSFDATAGTSYQFETNLLTLPDSILTLYGEDGSTILVENDDVDVVELRSRIDWTAVSSGTYYLQVAGFEDSDGSYRLTARITSDQHGDTFEEAFELNQIPTEVTARINSSDDLDWFTFDAIAGVVHEISIESEAVEARIYDADGTTLLKTIPTDDATRQRWLTPEFDQRFHVRTSAPQESDYHFQVSIPAGDANLDGVFNSADLVTVFAAGEYEDTTANNSSWAEGDWNGDGEFNSTDLVDAFSLGNYSAKSMQRALTSSAVQMHHRHLADIAFAILDKYS